VRLWTTIRISIISALMLLCASSLASATEYRGQVTFGGFPVPGATVTATQGTKKVSVVSDQGGVYTFDDLADGPWKIEIEMQCFEKFAAQVAVAPNMPPGKWELTLLPIDQLMARSKLAQAPPTLTPATGAPADGKKPENAAAGSADIPKPPDEQSEQSNDGFLVNGSWCLALNFRNKTVSDYWSAGSPIPANFFFAALAGVIWCMQFVCFKTGEPRMGGASYVGWAVLMASSILFSQLLGIFRGEWKGTGVKTRVKLASGLLLLIVSAVLAGFAGSL